MTDIKKLIESLEKLSKKKVVLKEASSLHCPNCHEDLGKDTENSALAYCGNCGEGEIYNERGETEDLTPKELAIFKAKKAKRNKGVMTGYMRNRY